MTINSAFKIDGLKRIVSKEGEVTAYIIRDESPISFFTCTICNERIEDICYSLMIKKDKVTDLYHFHKDCLTSLDNSQQFFST